MPNQPAVSVNTPKLWAFTWAPDDHTQYFNRKDRYKQFLLTAKHLLYKIFTNNKIQYKVITEVSTPYIIQDGGVGRLHLHGILTLSEKQRRDLYLQDIRILTAHGRVEIKPITDKEGWEDYINKQQELENTEFITQETLTPAALPDNRSIQQTLGDEFCAKFKTSKTQKPKVSIGCE